MTHQPRVVGHAPRVKVGHTPGGHAPLHLAPVGLRRTERRVRTHENDSTKHVMSATSIHTGLRLGLLKSRHCRLQAGGGDKKRAYTNVEETHTHTYTPAGEGGHRWGGGGGLVMTIH